MCLNFTALDDPDCAQRAFYEILKCLCLYFCHFNLPLHYLFLPQVAFLNSLWLSNYFQRLKKPELFFHPVLFLLGRQLCNQT